VHLGACEGAMCGGAAGGRAGLDAVYEKEVMQPLDSMRVELCKDARRVEACFGDEFIRRVGAGGE
jgi:hypothetical protein